MQNDAMQSEEHIADSAIDRSSDVADKAIDAVVSSSKDSSKNSSRWTAKVAEKFAKAFSKTKNAAKTTKAGALGTYALAAKTMSSENSSAHFLFLVFAFLMHLYNVSRGFNPFDIQYLAINIVFGMMLFIVFDGQRSNFHSMLESIAKTLFIVVLLPWLMGSLYTMTNGYGNMLLLKGLLNPIVHPMWIYILVSKIESGVKSFAVVVIIGIWMFYFLSIFASTMPDGQSVVSSDQQKSAWDVFTKAGDTAKTVVQSLFSLPTTFANFTKRQIAIATGDYYTGQVEKNQNEPLGVYLDNLESADPEYYTDEPATIWAELSGKSLLEKPISIAISCNASNSNKYSAKGIVKPSDRFNFTGIMEEYLDCRFNASQLRSGTNKISFFADFNFETMAYLKIYLIDKERLRELKRNDIDPLADYADKNPIAKYTNGPISIGMGTNTPPIAIDGDFRMMPKLGITIENRWKGVLKNISDMTIQIPDKMELVECDATHPFEKDTSVVEDGYNTYRLTDYGKKKLVDISGFAQPIKCRLKVDYDILEPSTITTRYIRVKVDYDYRISKNMDIDVKYRKDIEENKQNDVMSHFSVCKIGEQSLYDSSQGQRIVDAASELVDSGMTYEPESYSNGKCDVSGFIYAAFKKAGICGFNEANKFSTYDYSRVGKKISDTFHASELKPGDLLFFDLKEKWGTPDFVAIYAGDGKVYDCTKENGASMHPLSDIHSQFKKGDFRDLFYSARRYAYTLLPNCKTADGKFPKVVFEPKLPAKHLEIYDSNGLNNIKSNIDLLSTSNHIPSAILAAVISKERGFEQNTEHGIGGCLDVKADDDFSQILCVAKTLANGYAGKTISGSRGVYDECALKANQKERWMCVFEKMRDKSFAKDVWAYYTQWYKHICFDTGVAIDDFTGDNLVETFAMTSGSSITSDELEGIFSFTLKRLEIDLANANATVSYSLVGGSSGEVGLKSVGFQNWSYPFLKFSISKVFSKDGADITATLLGPSATTKDLREDSKPVAIWQGFVSATYDSPIGDGEHIVQIFDMRGKEYCKFTFSKQSITKKAIVDCMKDGSPVFGFKAKIISIYEGAEWYNNDHAKVQFIYVPFGGES